MPADSPRSSRMSGSSGPIARICGRIASDARNRPAMTTKWDRGATHGFVPLPLPGGHARISGRESGILEL